MVSTQIGIRMKKAFYFEAALIDDMELADEMCIRDRNYSIYEAALDLGCNPVKAFFRVILPEILPGILTGFLMAFTLSLDDFVISLFTGGSSQTLSVLIYSMTKKRVSPTINALSTLLFVSVLILLILANLGQIRSMKRSDKKAKS